MIDLSRALAEAPRRTVTLWMVNDLLEHDQLKRQLRAFRDTGWRGVIPRTYNGLRTEYLSQEWFACLRTIIDTAAELDMKVWLQAGYMPLAIPDLPAEQAMDTLTTRQAGEDLDPGDTVIAEAGGLVVIEHRQQHVLNLIDPGSVDAYIDRVYEQCYMGRFGEHFGKTVEAVWVDEPSLREPAWGASLLEAFEDQWGYDLRRLAASLFVPEGDWKRIRHDYRRTVAQLLRDAYFRRIEHWCKKHDLLFTGHLMGEDKLETQIEKTASTMPLYEHMGVPGIDHLTADLHWPYDRSGQRKGPRFVMTPKQCSSAADQNGQADVLAEMYGVSSPGLSFSEMKRIGEWMALLGINVRLIHGSFYSLRGRRKRIYPVSVNIHQPWWPDGEMVTDHFRHLHEAMSMGRLATDVLVVHPVESAASLYSPVERFTEEAVEKLTDSFARLSENLLLIRRGFHYGDEQMLSERGACDGRCLALGEGRYPAVLLHNPLTLRSTTLDVLEAFLDAGGTVLLSGAEPQLVDGRPDVDRLESFNARLTPVSDDPDSLDAALEKVSPRRFDLEAIEGDRDSVLASERLLKDGRRLVMLLNTSWDETVKVRLGLADEVELSEIDLATAEITPAGRELTFEPLRSRLMVLTPGKGGVKVGATPQPDQVVEVPGPWRIEPETANCLVLDFCHLRVGDEDFGPEIPVPAVQQILEEEHPRAPWTGPVTMTFEFQAEATPERLVLGLEHAADHRIVVNGREIPNQATGYFADPGFETVDIASACGPGTNTIQLIHDFQPLAKAKGLNRLFANLPGSEIEPIFVAGDFAVQARPSEQGDPRGCRRLSRALRMVPRPETVAGADLTVEGYPFFCGRLNLSCTVALEALGPDRRAWLDLTDLDACVARVAINGRRVGRVAWAPRRVEITSALEAGDNELRVELVSSLRNLIGPLHRPQGDPLECWGFASFSGRYHHATGTGYEDWYLPENRTRDTLAWTDEYNVLRFGLGQAVRILIGPEAS
jgi:hypothetical protein